MKKIFFTFYFLLFTVYSFSQTNKLYNFGTNTLSEDIGKLPNGNYIFATDASYDVPRLTIVNENGEWQNQIELNAYNSLFGNTVEVFNDKIYTLCKETAIFGDTTKYYLSFTCYSLNFDTIWNKKYFVDTTQIYPYNYINTNNGGFAITGSIDKGGYKYDGFLLKVDSLGNKQWQKEYGYSNSDSFRDIVQTEDGGYLLSGYSQKYNTGKYDWYIVRTDSVGNQIWDWVLHNPQNLSDGAVADLIQTQDGNFVAVGGQTYTCDYYCLQDARLLKFDINKNILLDTLYSEVFFDSQQQANGLNRANGFGKIKQKSNGNFLIIGYHMPYPHANIINSKLYEMDNNFNIIKSIKYNSEPFYFLQETIKDFIIEQDGSLAMIGDINTFGVTTPSQQVWFVKTDTNYCDGFCSCDTTLKFEFLDIPDTLPVNDTARIHFKITGGEITDEYNVTIELNYLSATKYIINKNNIQKDSIYYFEISKDILNNSEYATSLTFDVGDSIFVFYHATATDSSRAAFNNTIGKKIILSEAEVGIKEITNPQATIKIYPNPTKTSISLMFTDKADVTDKNIFIYDVFGRKVLEQSVIARKNNVAISIDVSSLPKGVYFVRVGSAVGKFIKN